MFRGKNVQFNVLGIDVYLCHQHITSKYPNSLVRSLPAPLQQRRKVKMRAAGKAKEGTHWFVHSFSPFIHQAGRLCSLAAGGDGCAVSAPLCWLVPGTEEHSHTSAGHRPPQSAHKDVFPAGDQPLHDCVQGEADSNFHKFFMPRPVTYGRETGDAAWGEDVLTFPL